MTEPPSNIIRLDAKAMLNAALAYARMGWHVLPLYKPVFHDDGTVTCSCRDPACHSVGKHPHRKLAPRGEHSATRDETVIRSWFAPGMPEINLGASMLRSGLAGIDIDPRNGGLVTLEQIEAEHGPLAADVEATTGGGGYHKVFTLAAVQNLPGKLGPGIDVKLNGFLVVWPSIHASGKQYEWEASSDPLDGAVPSPLPDWIRDLSRASSPPPAATAQGGARSVTPEQVLELKEALGYLDADDYGTWIDVGQALFALGLTGRGLWDHWSAGSVKFQPKEQGKKWITFDVGPLNYESIFTWATDAGWVNPLSRAALSYGSTGLPSIPDPAEVPQPARATVITVDDNVAPLQDSKDGREPDYPALLNRLPVKELQDLADWMSTFAKRPHPEVSIVGALSVGSVLTGRRFCSTNNNFTALQLVLCGDSYIGKNPANRGIDFLLAAKMPHLVGGSWYTHASAISTALRRAPAHLTVTDEFGGAFEEARRSTNGNGATVFAAIKKIYDVCSSAWLPANKAAMEADVQPVIKPSLTVLGITTPWQFYSEMTEAYIEGGTLNRFLIVNLDERRLGEKQMITVSPPPEHLIEWARTVRPAISSSALYSDEPTLVKVPFTAAAWRLLDDFDNEILALSQQLKKVRQGGLVGRWHENALRLATQLAGCRVGEPPIIDEELAQWAVTFARFHGEANVRALRKQFSGQDTFSSKLMKVAAYIVEGGKEGRSSSDLLRRFRIPTYQMKEILEVLIETHDLHELQNSPRGVSGRGRKRQVYAIDQRDAET